MPDETLAMNRWLAEASGYGPDHSMHPEGPLVCKPLSAEKRAKLIHQLEDRREELVLELTSVRHNLEALRGADRA